MPNKKNRQIKQISGRGAYNVEDLKAKAEQAGSRVKSLSKRVDAITKATPKGTLASIGSMFGPKGAMLGQAIASLTGRGSYEVDHNSLMTSAAMGPEAENIPMFSKGVHGNRVQHREFVKFLVAPTVPADFSCEAQPLSLTNSALFPWLTGIASHYQRFRVHGMVFYFRSTSTDYLNSGTVALTVNYNATEEKYTNMPAVLNSMFAASAKPSVSFCAPVECDPRAMPDGYYVRHERSTTGTTDTRMSTVGLLNIVTQGLTLPASTVLGELWVTYDVELISPYLGNNTISPSVVTVTARKLVTDTARLFDQASTAPITVNAGPPTFVRHSVGDTVEAEDLVIDTGFVNANFIRPRLTAAFKEGIQYYQVAISYRSVSATNAWTDAPSTVSEGTCTVLWRTAGAQGRDMPANAAGLGSYPYVAIIAMRPGQTLVPFGAGTTGGTGLDIEITITRLG
jgi:hypothetical protein